MTISLFEVRIDGPKRLRRRARIHCVIRECVGVPVPLTWNVSNRELQTTGKFAAGPVQRVQARAATVVLAGHLLHDDFRVGIDVEGFGLDGDGVLQGFHEGNVLGDIVVLMPDPLGDSNGFAAQSLNHYANARWARVSVRPAIDIRDQIGHSAPKNRSYQLKDAADAETRQAADEVPPNSTVVKLRFCEKNVGEG